MSLPYEEAVKVWAAQKYDLELSNIKEVEFDIWASSGWSRSRRPDEIRPQRRC